MANINRGRYTVLLYPAPVQSGNLTKLGIVTRGALVRELVRDSAGAYFALPGREPLITRKVIAAIEAFNLGYPTPNREAQRLAPICPTLDPLAHHAETRKTGLSE